MISQTYSMLNNRIILIAIINYFYNQQLQYNCLFVIFYNNDERIYNNLTLY